MTVRLGSRYELEAVLGRGGSGEVWRGSSPEGAVAIKVLRPELSNDPEIVERFVRERSLLLGVQSQNVVAVHDLVIEGDRLAIVMDLVTGGDLRTRLRAERTLRPLTAVSLMVQVLDGLAAVHDAGIVHRDLKPENLLLDESDDSSIRVADFGIARLSSSTRTTRTTGLLGTPRYIAPELSIRGRVTPAVDVYAAGVTLYEMLFGRVPFDGPHPAAVLRAHAEDLPYRPEGVPDSLWAIIAAMLEKNPADRPTAVEACEQLRAIRTDVVTLGAFPAQPRSGGPDTDETYTTDPHGNATDLTGIGRRNRSHTGPADADAPTRRRQRWLVPAVALAVVVAVVGTLVAVTGGNPKPAAPPYGYSGASPADAKVEHDWTFGSDRGDRLDGVMNVTPETAKGFGDGSSVVSAFPSNVTNLHFTPSPTKQITIPNPSAGKAAGQRDEVVRFDLPHGQHSFAVHYTADLPAAGTSAGRFDDLGWDMDKTYARVCYGNGAPAICPVRDRPTRLTFTQPLAGPVGPGQTVDLRQYLQAATKSGAILTGRKLTGVRWSVLDEHLARINRKGVLTGIAAGAVEVTAQVGDLKTASPITVQVDTEHVKEIVKLSIDGPGSTKTASQYRATAKFDDDSVEDVTPIWTVTPIADAIIDVNGVLLPLRPDRTVQVRAEILSTSGKTIDEHKNVRIGRFDGPPPTTTTTTTTTGGGGGGGDPVDQCSSQPGIQTEPCPGPTDQCPDLPGVQTAPCPPLDSDGDKIPDSVDQCDHDAGLPTTTTSGYYPTVNGCPPPDLVITDFGPDNPNPVAGECVSFHVTITNQGRGPTPSGSPVHLGVLFVIDPGVRNDHIWWEDNNPVALAAGQSITRTSSGGNQGSCADHSKWSAVTGDHTIRAEVNDKSGDGKHLQIFESNFGNNIPTTRALHVN